jgi:hypothetical protein
MKPRALSGTISGGIDFRVPLSSGFSDILLARDSEALCQHHLLFSPIR